jgi:DNA-binding CsgD family transcriptional regulator
MKSDFSDSAMRGIRGGTPAMQRTRPDSVRRAVARIRQLSCLGLGGEAAVPEILRELHGLVPAGSNIFAWAGAGGEISNVYTEHPGWVHMGPLYFAEFYERREREVILTFSESMRLRDGPAVRHVDSFLKVDRREFLRSSMFNEILRKVNDYQRLFVTVREGVRGLGGMLLGRGQYDPPFTGDEAKRLELIVPLIAHALAPRGNLDVELADTDDEGLIVAGLDGKILQLSSQAERLLLLACYPQCSPGALACDAGHFVLPPPVVRICRNLVRAFKERLAEDIGEELAPPVWRHRNVWGGFTFRAYWLPAARGAPPLLGVTVHRQEPLPLRFLRRMGDLPLSAREGEACLLLLAGHSRPTIAERLGVSQHTAIGHVRNIYAKLNVRNRAELAAKVLSKENVFRM